MTEEETPKNLKTERRAKLYGWLLYHIATGIFRTLHLTFVNEEGLNTDGKGAIFVTWHGRSLIPANVFRNRGYWALISLSRDGEMQKSVFQRFGFQIVRGSTGRGGVRGALTMARNVKAGGCLAFTPDGPRGPTHKVQQGVILMAEKSGTPIIPLGISASRRKLFRSWDAYMLPLPFSNAFFVVGEPIYIPPELADQQRAEYAEIVEKAINSVEKRSEQLAGFLDYPDEWQCG